MFNSTTLAKFILKRDRIQLPVWLIGIIGFTVGFVPIMAEMYGSDIERMVMGETMLNPAMVAMVGPVYGIENYTVGAMYANMMLLFMAITVALMNIFFVVRHTRADEESGRMEVIRSLPTGRLSALVGTLTVAIVVNVFLGIVTGLGLYAFGDESMCLNGSLLFGAIYSVTGLSFAGFTGLFVQLSKNTRTVLSYSFAFLGVNYLVRAVGDVSNETLARISPLGLLLRTEVYVNNYWWPIWIMLGVSIVVMGVALYLNSLRDLGDGFIPEKSGRSKASIFLQSNAGLTFRMVRGTILTWGIGMFILGVAYGSVFGDLDTFFETNEIFQQILPANEAFSMTEQFMTLLMVITTIIGTIPTLTIILRVKGEEQKNRLEHVLVRVVSRTQVLVSYTVSAVITSVLMILLTIIGLYVSSSTVMDNPISLSVMFEAGMVYLPAVWLMMSIAIFLIGVLPQATGWVWAFLGYSFLAVYLGGLLQLPEWMNQMTPFGNIPQIPVEELRWTPLFVLTGMAIVIAAVGFVGYNKRDIQG